MTPSRRIRGALGALWVAWGAHLVLSGAPAWLATRSLWALVGHRPAGAGALWEPGAGVALDTGRRWAEGGGGEGMAYPLLGAVVGALLLSPWLTMTWLTALHGPEAPLRQATLGGLRRYPHCVAVSLLIGTVGVLATAAAAMVPLGAHLLLEAHPNVALHDLSVLAGCLPALLVLWVWGAWHDQARAALLMTPHPLRAALQGLRTLGALRVATFAGYSLLGVALALVTLRLSMTPLSGTQGLLAVVVLGQLSVLARLVVRAHWLARLV